MIVRRHLRFGWWCLLLFLTLGAALEIMHGFKVDLYLNVANSTRRLMWTLAHAHGTLLALINLVFGLAAQCASGGGASGGLRMASSCLLGATIMLPAGFFLGAIVIYAGDPNLTILLVPLGALLLFIAVALAAIHAVPGRRTKGGS